MQVYVRRIVVSLLASLLFPILAEAHVFFCPDPETLDFSENKEAGKWEAELGALSDGMPKFFESLRYTTPQYYDGEGPRISKISADEANMKLVFDHGYYAVKGGIRYGCVYTNQGEEYIKVTLEMSKANLPGSHSLPLLVEVYGDAWSKEESEIECKADEPAKCGFHIPQQAMRYELMTSSKIEKTDAGVNLFGLLDQAGESKNISLPAVPGRQFAFGEGGLKEREITKLMVQVQGGELEMVSYLKAHGFDDDNREACSFQSTEVEQCGCARETIQKGIKSGGHLVIDVYQALDERKNTRSLRCDLYSLPSMAGGHHPHEHDHSHGGDL